MLAPPAAGSTSESATESGGRLAWPIPAVLGVIAGIQLALGVWWGVAWLILAAGWAWSDRRLALAGLALAAALAGFGVTRTVDGRPNPLTPWLGAQVTLRGDWDGQFLTLDEPRARVALAPRPTARPGPLVVSGRLVAPEGRRTPGGFDQAAWFRTQGGLFLPTPGAVLVAAKVRESQPEGGLRGYFRRNLGAGLPQREAALMQAIQLGDRSDIGREEFDEGYAVRDAFNRSGLAHLMALSGQNVALITVVLIWGLGRLGASPALRYGLPALMLIPYLTVLVNVSPSITRAVIMGITVLAGLALGRGKIDPVPLAALAALACLLLFPLWLLDLGFQLSFLAVLGLSLSPRAAALLPGRWPFALRLALVATVLAEAFTLPVIASNFGQLPLVGLPANLLAGPVMAALVPLGFAAGLLGPLAPLLNLLVLPLARLLLWIAETFGRAPVLSWGGLSPAGFVAYGVALGAGVLWLRGAVRAPVALGTLLACLVLTALPPLLRPAREIVFLDVGQGDATLIRAPGLTVLVDAGGSVNSDFDIGARTVVPALRALGVRKLDLVVATHADTDHIEGVSAVLREVPVGELWIGQRKEGDPLLADVLAAAQARGVPVREVRRGNQVGRAGVTLTVLWPPGNVWSTEDNENSVALRVESGSFRAALLGDLPDPAEAYVGAGDLALLKVAHHGSRYSTGTALLAQTTPRDALISVGRNTYGHPHPDVLARLAEAGTRVWRTDQVGTVRWPMP